MKNFIGVLVLCLMTGFLFAPNRIKTWTAETLTSSDLNTEFSNIYIGDISRTAGYFGSQDDIPLYVGSSQDTRIEWDTTQTTDSMLIGLGTGLILSVMEQADMTTDWAIASQTNPTLFVHSADATATTDYIRLTHDQTDAVIGVGNGNLRVPNPFIVDGDTDAVQAIIQGHSTQTSDVFVVEQSDGTDILTVANTGTIVLATDLSVANGGTGAGTFTDGGILLGSGTGAITALGAASNGQIPIGDGTTDPQLATITGTANQVTVTNGAASITLDFPDDLIINGTTPSITVGDGGAEDAGFLMDGNETNFGFGLDDSANSFVFSDEGVLGTDNLFELYQVGTGTSVQRASFYGANTGTPADNDESYLGFFAENDANSQVEIGRISWRYLDVSAADDDSTFTVDTFVNNSLTEVVAIGSSSNTATAGRVTITGELNVSGAATLTTALTVPNGGLGASSLTDGGVLLGSGSDPVTVTAVLADGEILIGDGSTDPVALDVGSSTSITVLGTIATGTWQATDVAVPYGGTGQSSLTDGGLLLGSGSGAITALGVAANGQIPIGDGSTDPQLATLTGTANEVAVTNGGGSITLSIPDASIFVTPRATGAAEFNSTVLIGANGTSLDGDVHLLASATDALPLVIETLSSQSTQAVEFHYSGSRVGYIGVTGTARKFVFDTADLGNDAAGPYVLINRNSNSTSAGSGYLAMADRGNQQYNVWPDNGGDLRIGTTIPIGSQDTSGTVVGTQTSPEAIKNILFTYPNIPGDLAYEKFQAVINTDVKEFNFRSGKYNQNFTGLAIPDGQHPWYGQDPVVTDLGTDIAPIGTAKSLNEMNMAGYFILSFKVLNKRIEELENEINRLHRNRHSDLALNR